MAKVKIGHAVQSEHNNANGAVGDQTTKEVLTADWYLRSKGWTHVFRAKTAAEAEIIAKTMEDICANDNIGYGQNDRTTSYNAAKAAGWNCKNIKVKCNTDCSEAVCICVNAMGCVVSSSMYTGSEESILRKTGRFNIYTSAQYTNSSDYLKRGDILLGPGHTAVVLSDGAKVTKEVVTTQVADKAATSFDKTLAGHYIVTDALNIRKGAGTNNSILVVAPKNTPVDCQGYFSTVSGTKWAVISFTLKDIFYVGFCSMKYLKKQ